jgi:leucyl-tRNA synthetase
LFTQGMICHETYQDSSGEWLEPAEIEKRDGHAFKKSSGVEVVIGPSEKMSKSKRNTVAPSTFVDIFGADSMRWFMLSDTPPERDIEWTEAGVEGCWRFVQRVHRLVTEAEGLPAPGAKPGEVEGAALELRRATHRAIVAVTEDLDALRFNRAVAQIYTLANAISGADARIAGTVRREALETLVMLIGPMMPHLAETCWEALGHDTMIAESDWPKADPMLVKQDTVTYAVQINGKLRATRAFAKGTDRVTVEATVQDLPVIRDALGGKSPKRVVFVQDRIVNIVA